MAYVDGELDPGARDEIEGALGMDPELAARAARQRNLRARLESVYAPELAEPVPERLLAALRATVREPVTNLEEARAARTTGPTRWAGTRWTGTPWRWTSMAAGVLLAVGAGFFLWRNSQSVMIRAADGALVASGALSRSLSNQFVGDSPPSSKVTVGLSFVAKSGDYCRTFSIGAGSSSRGVTVPGSGLESCAGGAVGGSGADCGRASRSGGRDRGAGARLAHEALAGLRDSSLKYQNRPRSTVPQLRNVVTFGCLGSDPPPPKQKALAFCI